MTGCQTFGVNHNSKIYLNRWLSMDTYEGEPSFSHILNFVSGEQSHQLLFQGEANSSGMVMVGMSEVGIPLFEIQLRNNQIDYNSRVAMELPVSAGTIIEAFQLIFWPEQAVQNELKSACRVDNRRERREIYCHNVLAVEINYSFENNILNSVQYKPVDTSWIINITTLEQ
ncbi:DUF3261 domain-containing protein [Pleionea sediminis]|uniref:DUF3261 domain-containing protein n=1 Tax=Pleionea sediminis TaxID=2569479 RepID=UPI00197B95B0|nr:DUF3261 domain-containing protein [Pleionea sediminis]